MDIRNAEYLYIKCESCSKHGGDPPVRVKLAKNKGADWKTSYNPQWFYDFMFDHSGCKTEDIVLEWE